MNFGKCGSSRQDKKEINKEKKKKGVDISYEDFVCYPNNWKEKIVEIK